ncbi:polyprotein [Phytophthora megakarya]|uniref:Polyprotein n=1 Tax=Phytophthora megakarya TaxID=4795 RepID=A0A225X0M5_9STRA|nr:polyprotein [Phytophthora megakarya]
MTPFFVNFARHPRVPAMLAVGHPTESRDFTLDSTPANTPVLQRVSQSEAIVNAVTRAQAKKSLAAPRDAASQLAEWTERSLIDPARAPEAHQPATHLANYAPRPLAVSADHSEVSEFALQRQSITRFVRDALQSAMDKQTENADKHGRKNMASFHTDNVCIQISTVTNLGTNKLDPPFIGPFTVVNYRRCVHSGYPVLTAPAPTFYVGRLKCYYPAEIPDAEHGTTAVERESSVFHDGLDAPSGNQIHVPAGSGELQVEHFLEHAFSKTLSLANSSRFDCRSCSVVRSTRHAASSARSDPR